MNLTDSLLIVHSRSYVDVRCIDVVTSPSIWHCQNYSRVVDYMSIESNKPYMHAPGVHSYVYICRLILKRSHLSTPKLTGMHILVSVLGTVGYGNVVNTTWIIKNFLHSCMGKEYNVYIEYSIKYVHACNNYLRIHWLISIFNNNNCLCMQLYTCCILSLQSLCFTWSTCYI